MRELLDSANRKHWQSLEATHVDITEGSEATGLAARLGNFRELKGKNENIREHFHPLETVSCCCADALWCLSAGPFLGEE